MEKDDDASRWAVAYTFQVSVQFEKKIRKYQGIEYL